MVSVGEDAVQSRINLNPEEKAGSWRLVARSCSSNSFAEKILPITSMLRRF
jgi:hypothetical protein